VTGEKKLCQQERLFINLVELIIEGIPKLQPPKHYL